MARQASQYSTHFDIAELLLEDRPWLIRAPFYAMVGLVLSTLAWSWCVRMDVVVRAPGKVQFQAPSTRAEAPFEGRLTRLNFNVGETVSTGDVLFEMESAWLATDLAVAKTQLHAVRSELASVQAALLQEQYRHELANAAGALQVRRSRESLQFHQLELHRRLNLVSERLTSFMDVRVSDIEGQMPELRYQLRAARNQIGLDKIEHEHNVLTLSERQELARARENELTLELDRLQKLNALARSVAPFDGTIVARTRMNPGSHVALGEAVYELVPSASPLYVEVAVADKDRSRITPAQDARLKVTAFPYRKHGALTGTVLYVAPDSMPGQTQYAVHVRIDDMRGLPLSAGMTLEAEIVESRKRVIQYFVDTLLRELS
jgi:HlyD family secretion protein